MTICCSLTSNRRLREQPYPRPPQNVLNSISIQEKGKCIVCSQFCSTYTFTVPLEIRYEPEKYSAIPITYADDIAILAWNRLYLLELFTDASKTKYKLQTGTAGRRTQHDINIGEYHSNFTHEKISKSKLLWRTCKFRMYLRKINSYTRNNTKLLQFNHREYVVKHLKTQKLRWIRYVLRMDQSQALQLVFDVDSCKLQWIKSALQPKQG